MSISATVKQFALDGSNATIATNDVSVHVSTRLLVQQVDGSDCSVIFSPVSGSLDVATPRDIELLQQLASNSTDAELSSGQQEFASYLLERGYAYSTPDEEERLLEKLVRDARSRFAATAPNVYTICPTLACNLACSYCFEGDSMLKPQGAVSDESLAQLFTAIDSLEAKRQETLAASGNDGKLASELTLFGGEPLLPSTKRQVGKILEFAESRGFMVGCTTNGVNIIRYADLLARYVNSFEGIQITLDGPAEMHDSRRHRLGGQGTFDEIVRGIDFLLEIGVPVQVRMNMDTQNMPTLPELCVFVKEKGWAASEDFQLIVAPVTVHAPSAESSGCGAASYQKALDELTMHRQLMKLASEHPIVSEVCSFAHLRHLDHVSAIIKGSTERETLPTRSKSKPGPRYWYCEQGTGQQYVFTPDGCVYTCTEAVGKVKHAVGRYAPSFEMWQEQSRDWLGRTILSNPKCRACKISTLCGGGCHFAAREKAEAQSKQRDTDGSELLQIGVGRLGRRIVESQEPYCAGAEDLVREYLKTEGRRLLAA